MGWCDLFGLGTVGAVKSVDVLDPGLGVVRCGGLSFPICIMMPDKGRNT